jgi:hypothetical protein
MTVGDGAEQRGAVCWECEIETGSPKLVALRLPDGRPRTLTLCRTCYDLVARSLAGDLAGPPLVTVARE